MADKVNKEESVARVYQFLNKQKDWKTAADSNNDGTIIKTEFREYLLGSGFKFNNGENKQDLVDAFWKTIDFNTKGKVNAGSAINDKNALNTAEIETIENSIEATKKVITFMQDKEAPSELDAQYRTAWKNSVKQGLIYKASEYLKTGKLEDINDEWLNNAYKLSSAKATADYAATDQIKKELGNVEGYKVADDQNLKNVVNEYVATLEENPKHEAEIISDIKQIVAAYVDTAKTNSKASTDLLAQYGYDPDDSLNDLQLAVLTNEITDKILSYIKSNYADVYTDEYKSQIEAAVKQYVEEYLSDKSANEFTEVKEFDVSTFAASDDFNTLIKDIKEAQQKLQDARSALNTYIAEILAEKDDEKTAIVKKVIGSTDAVQIANILLGLKTVDAIEAKKTELENELAPIEAKREAERAAKEAEEAEKRKKQEALSNPFMMNGRTYSVENILSSADPIEYGLSDDVKGWSEAATEATKNLDTFLTTLVSALEGFGYTSEALNAAKRTTQNYYNALFEAADTVNDDNDGRKSVYIAYRDETTGKNVGVNTTFGYQARYTNSKVNSIGDIGYAGDSGYFVGCDMEARAIDRYNMYLDLRVVVQKFLSFLK